MMNTPGGNFNFIVIGDTDALIAILHEEDANFELAKETVVRLLQKDAQVVFPVTSIVEAITTLTRKLNKPTLAKHVIQQIKSGSLAIDSVDKTLLDSALELFNPNGSKQNTLFDAIVAAMTQRHNTKTIFSFDEWYKKLGFTLASDLVKAS